MEKEISYYCTYHFHKIDDNLSFCEKCDIKCKNNKNPEKDYLSLGGHVKQPTSHNGTFQVNVNEKDWEYANIKTSEDVNIKIPKIFKQYIISFTIRIEGEDVIMTQEIEIPVEEKMTLQLAEKCIRPIVLNGSTKEAKVFGWSFVEEVISK